MSKRVRFSTEGGLKVMKRFVTERWKVTLALNRRGDNTFFVFYTLIRLAYSLQVDLCMCVGMC